MRRAIRPKDLLNPDRILSNLLRDYVEGKLGGSTMLYRAVVIKVDHVGGVLEKEPPNPKGSIQARVITGGINTYTRVDSLPVFWPTNPHHITPIKEGEHVYVCFEDEARQHGIWLTRAPDQLTTDDLNLTPGVKKYEDNLDNDLSGVGAQAADQDTEVSDAVPITRSPELTVEKVQPFTARVGDHVIHGSNNTMIVLGRDRPADKASGLPSEAGTIDIVSGRAAKENMDMATDKSRIYVTMQSDVDGNFDIQVGEPSGPSAAVVVKSDQVRVVARNGMKLVVEGGDLTIEGANIIIGNNAKQSAVLGDKLKKLLEQILDAIVAETHPTPAGPSGPPVNAAQFEAIKARLATALSSTVKVKA